MKQPLLTVAALAMGLALTMPALADNTHIPGKVEMEGHQKVKVFQFEEQQTPNCTVKGGSVLKYYPDGTMKFEGDVMCKQALRFGEFEVKTQMYNEQGRKVFSKEFQRYGMNDWTNQWVGMADEEHSSDYRSRHWDEVQFVNLFGEGHHQ